MNKPHPPKTSISAKQLTGIEQHLCPISRLPEEYRRYLLRTGGGSPRHTHFSFQWNTGEKQISTLQRFLGIDIRLDEYTPRGCVVKETLRLRAWIPGDAIMIGWVDEDDLLLLYVSGDRAGQIWLRTSLEIAGDGPLEQSLHFVAKSFSAFCNRLHTPRIADPYAPCTIALDAPGVRGAKLARILECLGCERFGHPGVVSSSPRFLPAWIWQNYQNVPDPGGPAFLSIEKNRTMSYAAKYDARPIGHPVLRVSVTKTQRAACLKELLEALGPAAVRLD